MSTDNDQVFSLGEEFQPPVQATQTETTNEDTTEVEPLTASDDAAVTEFLQYLGETHPALLPHNLKSPNAIYHLGNMITPNVSVDYLNLYRNYYPKHTNQDGEAVSFSNPDDANFAENFAAAMTFYTPQALGDRCLEKEGSKWESGYRMADDRLYRGQNLAKSGNTAQQLARRITNSSVPMALWMPHTGIYLTFRGPHESEYCDYDMLQSMETASIGRHTYGMMMNLSSGLYMKSMLEFALRAVTSTNYDYGNQDMIESLIRRLDPRDYGRVLMGPTLAKFPAGLPWTIMCASGTCKHVESFDLNISNALLINNNAFTKEQRQYMTDSMFKTVTDEEVEKYRSDIKSLDDEFVWKHDNGKIVFKFAIGNLFKYITRSVDYAQDLHDSITGALGANATEYERRVHINTVSESRRLTRYAHQVESIRVDVMDGDDLISSTTDKYSEIVDMLGDFTHDRSLVNDFEEAYRKFLIANTHAVLAHEAKPCPSCNTVDDTEQEQSAFRGYIPISPDKVFFEVSQAISTVQKLLSNRSD